MSSLKSAPWESFPGSGPVCKAKYCAYCFHVGEDAKKTCCDNCGAFYAFLVRSVRVTCVTVLVGAQGLCFRSCAVWMSQACSSASVGATSVKRMSPRVCIFICDRVGHIADYLPLWFTMLWDWQDHQHALLVQCWVLFWAVIWIFIVGGALLRVQSIWPDIWLRLSLVGSYF